MPQIALERSMNPSARPCFHELSVPEDCIQSDNSKHSIGECTMAYSYFLTNSSLYSLLWGSLCRLIVYIEYNRVRSKGVPSVSAAGIVEVI
jgi:hypothetical protein